MTCGLDTLYTVFINRKKPNEVIDASITKRIGVFGVIEAILQTMEE